jgi:MFS family permease
MSNTHSFPTPSQSDFTELDNAKISSHHWKIMFISGMGFFTDAYDLFIIGVVMTLLKPLWHVQPLAEGLVESTALLAAAIGALLFGRVADMLGRKRIYGFEVLILAAGCSYWPQEHWRAPARQISCGLLCCASFWASASEVITR